MIASGDRQTKMNDAQSGHDDRRNIVGRTLHRVVNLSERQATLIIVSAVVLMALAAPIVNYALSGISFVGIYQESLANRYFGTFRSLHGDYINVGQGPLLFLFQYIPFSVTNLFIESSVEDLHTALQTFGFGIDLLFLALLAAATFYVINAPKLENSEKLTLIAMPAFVAFVDMSGFLIAIQPDYHKFSVPLYTMFLAYIGRFGSFSSFRVSAMSARTSALIGMFCGIAFSLKFTYAILPLLILGGLLLCGIRDRNSARECIVRGAVSVGAAAATYAAILIIFYQGNLDHVSTYLASMREYIAGASGVRPDPSFGRTLIDSALTWPVAERPDYLNGFWIQLYTLGIFVALALAALSAGLTRSDGNQTVRTWRSFVPLFIGLFTVGLFTWGMYQRGGQGSYIDTLQIIWPAAFLIAREVWHSEPWRTRMRATFIVFTVAIPATFIAANPGFVATNAEIITSVRTETPKNGYWKSDLYDWNRSHEVPVAVLVPQYPFLAGTLEERIMMGFDDYMWSSWTRGNSNPIRQQYFPYYSTGGWQHLDDESSHLREAMQADTHIVMWTENAIHGAGPIPRDLEDTHDRYLEKYGFTRALLSGECRNWVVRGLRVISCLVTRGSPILE